MKHVEKLLQVVLVAGHGVDRVKKAYNLKLIAAKGEPLMLVKIEARIHRRHSLSSLIRRKSTTRGSLGLIHVEIPFRERILGAELGYMQSEGLSPHPGTRRSKSTSRLEM